MAIVSDVDFFFSNLPLGLKSFLHFRTPQHSKPTQSRQIMSCISWHCNASGGLSTGASLRREVPSQR